MEIYNHTKMYCVYAIKSSDGLIYVGSTSNLVNRIRHHISTFKTKTSTCSSKIILEKGNYNVSVLRKDILTKQAAEEAEYNFIKGYGADCVNKNTPVLLVDFKQYQREYQQNLRKKKRLLSEKESSEQN